MTTGGVVIVVGGGNAALCAALSARETGADVVVLERAPHADRGGNSTYTAGAMRVVYNGIGDVLQLVPDLTQGDLERTDFGVYTEKDFFSDLARLSEYRTDPELADVLVSQSYETLVWMRSKGVRFLPIYGRQAYEVDGRFKFWGGLTFEVTGGGPGLVDSLTQAANAASIRIEYDARAVGLVCHENRVTGARVRKNGHETEIRADAVVLASGGFQSNPAWRTKYLGPGWDLAKVRGTRFNTGDGHRMAMDIGAASWGQWSGCHAVAWDRNAPAFGDLKVGDQFQKHSYPIGVMVNLAGERFVDEGADFRNYTYAKYGHAILRQPAQIAWQVFDARVSKYLRDEYRIREVTKYTSDTLGGLAAQLEGIDVDAFLATVRSFNEAVRTDVPFDMNVKDGRGTTGLAVDKTNWANPIDTPPFEAYAVTCGITFTFGGLHISPDAEVLDDAGMPIHGLYAAGELVGGIFYFNYPGGSGLTSGSVFGRIAGRQAGEIAQSGQARTSSRPTFA